MHAFSQDGLSWASEDKWAVAVTPVAPGLQCEGGKDAVSSSKRARMQRRTPNSDEETRKTPEKGKQ